MIGSRSLKGKERLQFRDNATSECILVEPDQFYFEEAVEEQVFKSFIKNPDSNSKIHYDANPHDWTLLSQKQVFYPFGYISVKKCLLLATKPSR